MLYEVLGDNHYQTLSGIETIPGSKVLPTKHRDNHYQTLSGIETSGLPIESSSASCDNHYQTLSGIETMRLGATIYPIYATIITKPFQGLKLSIASQVAISR